MYAILFQQSEPPPKPRFRTKKSKINVAEPEELLPYIHDRIARRFPNLFHAPNNTGVHPLYFDLNRVEEIESCMPGIRAMHSYGYGVRVFDDFTFRVYVRLDKLCFQNPHFHNSWSLRGS